ncbi:hypothetical protein B9Z55_028009 [Caenorhabditis nigoni]|uniref:Uncharacterized protein n=1 Tax=Caenorhabditis nigoni TaxID=1611254 RepID=A0A2G5SDN0_9PELO|nr:hypothetical protein B9Z55_028009 [Caenorhabditis nigoni]
MNGGQNFPYFSKYLLFYYYSVLSRNHSAWISECSFLIFLSILFFSNIQTIDMFKWMADNEVLFHRTHPSHMQVHETARREDSGKDRNIVVWSEMEITSRGRSSSIQRIQFCKSLRLASKCLGSQGKRSGEASVHGYSRRKYRRQLHRVRSVFEV